MKKRNKRIAAMLLSGLMTLSLTACGQNAPAQRFQIRNRNTPRSPVPGFVLR